MYKHKHRKIRLVQIARKSIELAEPSADLSEIKEILEKKWLKGAKYLNCDILVFCDKGFLNDKTNGVEISPYLRRQMLSAFGELSEYQAGSSFRIEKDELFLIELELLKNFKCDDRIQAAYFVRASDVEA